MTLDYKLGMTNSGKYKRIYCPKKNGNVIDSLSIFSESDVVISTKYLGVGNVESNVLFKLSHVKIKDYFDEKDRLFKLSVEDMNDLSKYIWFQLDLFSNVSHEQIFYELKYLKYLQEEFNSNGLLIYPVKRQLDVEW
ncbi:hypothetical protein KY334_06750 [Candidatus Woesearchaeota archaeon]|nr:hypothetical protein [Candidatus Woesearchaeota archaeon]